MQPTTLVGLKLVRLVARHDARGFFVKTIHAPLFAEHGMRSDFVESYYSVSDRFVLRGMHFQQPPDEHAKLVYCLSGVVLDVSIDLRRASPTYGQCFAIELDGERPSGLYIPEGVAHGFLTLSEKAMLMYSVTSVYAPSADAGVRWDSIGFSWPTNRMIISDRDRAFPTLSSFRSPF